jgi:hypothetical protein
MAPESASIMKTTRGFLFLLVPLLTVVALVAGSCASTDNHGGPAVARAGVRLGVFDSRALAMAHYRSEAFRAHMGALFEELATAKAAGDSLRVAELERQGPEMQAMVHKQGFGTYPVDNILEMIENELPDIAAAAGVDVIVSKWQVVHQAAGFELIDVTAALVQPFAPDEETLEVIESIHEAGPRTPG